MYLGGGREGGREKRGVERREEREGGVREEREVGMGGTS